MSIQTRLRQWQNRAAAEMNTLVCPRGRMKLARDTNMTGGSSCVTTRREKPARLASLTPALRRVFKLDLAVNRAGTRKQTDSRAVHHSPHAALAIGWISSVRPSLCGLLIYRTSRSRERKTCSRFPFLLRDRAERAQMAQPLSESSLTLVHLSPSCAQGSSISGIRRRGFI